MDLKTLARAWLKEAEEAAKESEKRWNQLRTGELPQEDAVIYSVYELEQHSQTLRRCAQRLMKVIERKEPK